MLTHADVLRRGASSYGHRIAVSFDGRDLSYADLAATTNRLASGLVASGLRPGDRVVWIQANHLDYLLLYYATAAAGLAFSPLNPRLPAGEVVRLLDVVEPSLVIAGEDVAGLLPAHLSARLIVHGTPEWLGLLDTRAGLLPTVGEDCLHEIVFTSGTTGQAKGVMRSQRKRILDSLCAALAYQLTRHDHMLFFAPQFHVGGGAAAGQVLVQGGRVTILPGFDPERIGSAIAAGATYMLGVPAHYSLLFESGVLDGVDTTGMRGCFVGGSVASRRVFDTITQTFPAADIVHGYGSTESGPHTTAVRGPAFLEHFGTLGLPIPGTEVRIISVDGSDVDEGQPGELWVRSETVMDGYLARPDLTEAAFGPDGWLRTGDVVRRDAEGYLYLVERLTEMIITGGENVFPSEIEEVVSRHSAVAEVAVIGCPDPVYEERIVALVRLAPDATTTAEDITAHVRRHLAPFKTPRTVVFVDDFPRTPLGKIAKSELKSRYGSVFGAAPP
jgi:acyl-CoA synthetase (AMP-forming)/AMP-acid ligase II